MLGLSAATKLLNKTATTIFTGATSSVASGGGGGSGVSGVPSSGSGTVGGTNSTYSAAANAAALASSHMKTFTQDISSTARNIGSLKWTTTAKN